MLHAGTQGGTSRCGSGERAGRDERTTMDRIRRPERGIRKLRYSIVLSRCRKRVCGMGFLESRQSVPSVEFNHLHVRLAVQSQPDHPSQLKSFVPFNYLSQLLGSQFN